MITLRWVSFTLALVSVISLSVTGDGWLAVIFAATFLVHLCTYDWVQDDPDPESLTSLDVRERSRLNE